MKKLQPISDCCHFKTASPTADRFIPVTADYMFIGLQKHFGGNFFEKKLFVMEFKRDSVVVLYLAEKPQVAIVRALQCINVNKSFVSRTIARYRDTGSVGRSRK